MKHKWVVLVAGLVVLLVTLYFQQPKPEVQPQVAETPASLSKAVASAATSEVPLVNFAPVDIPEPRATVSASSSADFAAVAAKLALSADNGKIEFIKNTQGQVIREMDQDPASPSFKKPISDYGYQNGMVSSVTRYEYNSGGVTIYQLQVAYDAVGNITDFRESTRTEQAR